MTGTVRELDRRGRSYAAMGSPGLRGVVFGGQNAASFTVVNDSEIRAIAFKR
jgi:hypothetical protein